jgi:hypothetical protein
MPEVALVILHNGLERLVEASMDQTPDMLNIIAKGKHMAPGAGPTRLGRARLDIRIDTLPMLHLTIDSDEELESAGRGLVFGAPVVLYHDRWRVVDAFAKNFAGDPGRVGVGATVAPEELHLAAVEDCDDVDIAHAVRVVQVQTDVGLHEGGPALEDCVETGDDALEIEVAVLGISLPLL